MLRGLFSLLKHYSKAVWPYSKYSVKIYFNMNHCWGWIYLNINWGQTKVHQMYWSSENTSHLKSFMIYSQKKIQEWAKQPLKILCSPQSCCDKQYLVQCKDLLYLQKTDVTKHSSAPRKVCKALLCRKSRVSCRIMIFITRH